MTIKQILSDCLVKMGKEDFADNATLSDDEQALQDRLVACINLVWRDVCANYIPLEKEETVTFADNKMEYQSLAQTMLYPIRLTKNGVEQDFVTLPTALKSSFNGTATLVYAYMPSVALTAEDEIESVRLTADVVSDGALGEYWYANKVFDLAAAYDTEFRSSLGMLRHKGKKMIMKSGRWND